MDPSAMHGDAASAPAAASRKRQREETLVAEQAPKQQRQSENPAIDMKANEDKVVVGAALDCADTKLCQCPDSADTTGDPPLVRVAVIVPFRDNHTAQRRQAQLDAFVPHMTQLLQKQPCTFHIFIIEQSLDGRKFNRGKLLNAGFDMARNDYDTFIFHDVDLLPGDELAEYYAQRPTLGPFHIARVWDRYNGNPNYFGGIVVFTKQHFIQINGFPNNFWGWGGEDDELFSRVVRRKLTIQAPWSGSITDLEDMGLEEKLDVLRNEKWKCTVKRELLKEHQRTWKKNGLKGLAYEYVDALSISDHCTKITVNLGPNGHWSDARSSLERTPMKAPEEQQQDSDRNKSEGSPLDKVEPQTGPEEASGRSNQDGCVPI